MEDKIREAIKALEDKVSVESAMEVNTHAAEIEEVARKAYEEAKKAEVEKIHASVYAKYEPAIRVLNEVLGPVESKPEEPVSGTVSEPVATFPKEGA